MAGLFDFNAAADPSDPASYQGMLLRQRVAEAMLKQGGRRGYPKNFGEGLTAIGDALGERGQMQALLGAQAKIDAARRAEIAASPPPGAVPAAAPRAENEDTGDVPVRTAAVGPTETDETPGAIPMPSVAQAVNAQTPFFPASSGFPASTAPRLDPTVIVGTDPNYTPAPSTGPTTTGEAAPWLRDTAAVQQSYRPQVAQGGLPGQRAAMPPPQDGDISYQPTASLQGAGGTMSDAPPITGATLNPNVRNAVARTLAARGGPQPNPTQEGPQAPVSPQPSVLGSPPEAARNPPIVSDIQPVPRPGAQMAQATMTRPQPLTPQPTPPVQAPGIYDRPVPPTKPPPEPKSGAQTTFEQKALRNEGVGGDPALTSYYKGQAAVLEAERARKEAFTMKEYENRLAEHGTADRAWIDAQRSFGKTQAETTEAQAKALAASETAKLTERTGLPADVVLTKFDALKKTAEKDAYSLQQIRLATEALNKGIVSGAGGEFRLNLERAKAFFGNKSAAEIATNSQLYLAAVKSTIGNALQNLQPGDTRVTNSDVLVATGMIGGDLSLQKEAQRKLLGVQMGDVHKRINEYEDLKDRYLGGLKPEKMFDVKVDPIHPRDEVAKAWTDKLLKHQDNYEARAAFDKEFGPGAAELEIGRARRRNRLGQ